MNMQFAEDDAADIDRIEDTRDAMPILLDESRWQIVVTCLPPLVRARAVNGGRTRRFFEAVLWVATTHQPWGRLPATCGPWHSIYVRFTRWAREGIWDQIIQSLTPHEDLAVPLRRLVDAYLFSHHPAAARRTSPRFRLA